MKKFIFTWAIFLLPAVSALAQTSAPADTGTVAAPVQDSTPPKDTGTVAPPPQESRPADTGTVVAPSQERIPADTGTVGTPPPSESAPPTDTAAAAPQERPSPADSGTAAPPPADTQAVPKESTPVETPAAAPAEEEEETTKEPKPPNRFALGIVFNDETPVSMRAWFNPKVGLDLGLGILVRQVEDQTVSVPSPESTTTFLDLSFDLGIPVRVLRQDKVDFIVRPGFGFRTRPVFDQTSGEISVETGLELELNGSVGFEYYPFEKASFGLFAGIALVVDRPGGTGNTILRVESLPKKAANFSFRYYLF